MRTFQQGVLRDGDTCIISVAEQSYHGVFFALDADTLSGLSGANVIVFNLARSSGYDVVQTFQRTDQREGEDPLLVIADLLWLDITHVLFYKITDAACGVTITVCGTWYRLEKREQVNRCKLPASASGGSSGGSVPAPAYPDRAIPYAFDVV